MSEEQGDAVPGDAVPGDGFEGEGGAAGVRTYLLGLGLAVLLTAGSFIAAGSGLIWGPAIPAALIALAVAQIGIHLVFFLHLTSGPENTNNALALAFGTLIVVLVVGGSLWIMAHLDHRLMPMSRMLMDMQR